MSKRKRRKKRTKATKLKTSNTVLIVLGVFLLAFIITMIVIFCVKGSTPDVLIQYVLGAGGLETLALAIIKVAKVFAGEKVNLQSDSTIINNEGEDACG